MAEARAVPDPIAGALVEWYRASRRDLPWRRTRDPYAIWVSEVMLQQTRVPVVIPYWQRWMARFPGPAQLAAAPLDDVLAAWSGLGYYGRARNLHRGAREVVARYGGRMPDTAAELRSLPGIGRYTAGAIASIAHGRREPLVDGNVARVLARLFAVEEDVKSAAGQKRLWQLAGELVPAEAPGDFNQALMELGATVCAPAAPRCQDCPLHASCQARLAGRERELPRTPERTRDTDKPILKTAAAWVERGGRILLARRAPEGLFGGLWELPQAARPAALAHLLRDLGLAWTAPPRPVHRHRQVLSHRRLAIDVYVAPAAGRLRGGAPNGHYERAAWHSPASLAGLGLAAASRVILGRYRELDGWSEPRRPSRSSPRATTRSSKG
jgi:A/G-specific adenine glycosylase